MKKIKNLKNKFKIHRRGSSVDPDMLQKMNHTTRRESSDDPGISQKMNNMTRRESSVDPETSQKMNNMTRRESSVDPDILRPKPLITTNSTYPQPFDVEPTDAKSTDTLRQTPKLTVETHTNSFDLKSTESKHWWRPKLKPNIRKTLRQAAKFSGNFRHAKSSDLKSTDVQYTEEKHPHWWTSKFKPKIRKTLRPTARKPTTTPQVNKSKLLWLYGCIVAYTVVLLVLIFVYIYQAVVISDIEKKSSRFNQIEKDNDWLRSRIEDLELRTSIEYSNINTEIIHFKRVWVSYISSLNQKDEDFQSHIYKVTDKVKHTEQGRINFKLAAAATHNKFKPMSVIFDRPYKKPPKVFISVTRIEGFAKGDDTWHQVYVTQTNSSGFEVECAAIGGSRLNSLAVDWISFATY